MLPRGAERIKAMRLRGERPADPLLVSFVGDLPWAGPTVYARADTTYDWRFLVDLPTIVVVAPGVSSRENLMSIFGMARLYPTLVDLPRKTVASVLDRKPLRLLPFPKHHPGWQELFA